MEKNKKKRFLMELSLAEASGWAALLVFICGWFFILGVFVGRGLVPVPGEKETFKKHFAELKEQSLTQPETPGEEEPATPVKNVPPAPVPETPAAQSDRETPRPRAVLPPATDQPEKKPATEKSARDNAKGKPDDPGGKIFTIQVASLRDQKTADQVSEKLKNQNYTAYIVKATLSDNVTWYRLRCGQFANRDEATPLLEKLRKDGYSPILVRR